MAQNSETLGFQEEATADMLYITNAHPGSRRIPIIDHLSACPATGRNSFTRHGKTVKNPASYVPG